MKEKQVFELPTYLENIITLSHWSSFTKLPRTKCSELYKVLTTIMTFIYVGKPEAQ